jgi:WD40 repeat protein
MGDSFDCGEPLQALSLNWNQEHVAIASKTHVLLYQLLPRPALSQQFHLLTEGGNNFKMTDVEWNLYDNDKIAASATNGSIAVFNLNTRNSRQTKQEWDSGEISRAVNRIGWHSSDKYQLLSAHQDGQVKIWDTARQKNPCLKIMAAHGDACRQASFDPFHPNIIAAIYETGSLMIWDRRNPDHALHRISAHAESGLTLEWSPNKEGLLATGSRDKTVKIWDINSGLEESSEGERPISATLSRPIHVIHTPAPLECISWRPAEGPSSRRQFQIATTSSNESGRGDINVWDAMNPNIPACVLRGHTDGCTGFQWLDTPSSATGSGTSVFQHILSVGKDNKLLVQDLRNGYFPGQHISGHVVAVSAMGHVAFQRGTVDRVSPTHPTLPTPCTASRHDTS